MEKYSSSAQNKIDLYAISGMGTDERAFEVLKRYFKHPITYIPWIEPTDNESLQSYALRMTSQYVDRRASVRLCIGLSFGGVTCLQALEAGIFTHVILISSVKCRGELSPLFRLMKVIPVHKLFPPKFLKALLIRSGLIPAGIRHENQKKFHEMFNQFSPEYFKWCIHQLVNIPESMPAKNVYHIHGTHDEVFSYKYICRAEAVPGGSHLMILTRAKEISQLIQQKIQQVVQTNTSHD